jgi:hypothetical protein
MRVLLLTAICFFVSGSIGAQDEDSFRDPFLDLEENSEESWEEPEVVDVEEGDAEPSEMDAGDDFGESDDSLPEPEFESEESGPWSEPVEGEAPSAAPMIPSPPPSDAPRIPQPTRIEDLYPEEAPAAPQINPGLKLPEAERPRGPVSEDIFRSRQIGTRPELSKWHFYAGGGVAPGLVDRPGQIHFELATGYQMSEGFEWTGLLHYRTREDRVLSLIVLPSWRWRIYEKTSLRIDLLAGAGLGWSFRGIQGNDFQFGHFPVRTRAAALFYAAQGFAIVTSLDTESFLMEYEVGEGTRFLFQSQALFGAGVRFEF